MEKDKPGQYSLSEILHQPEGWRSVLEVVKEKRLRIEQLTKEAELVIFSGCGSAHNIALTGASTYQNLVGKRASASVSSEVFLFPKTVFVRDVPSLFIPISRSGKTSETVFALQYANNLQIPSLAMTCYSESPLAQNSQESIVLPGLMEKSLVTTKSVTGMMLATQLISAFAAGSEEYLTQLEGLPALAEGLIRKYHLYCKEIGETKSVEEFAFLGSGPLFGVARECQLNLKEMTLLPADSHHALEFRHGPKSRVREKMLIVFLVSDSGREYEIDLLSEVKSIGGKTLVICDRADERIIREADYLIELNSQLPEFARAALYMPAIHLIALYRALSEGLDPDSPKHLDHYVKLVLRTKSMENVEKDPL